MAFRPRRTIRCVTHCFGDADSWGSTWLARRYLFPIVAPGAREVWIYAPFNPRGWPAGERGLTSVLRSAFAVFDVGGEFDVSRLRFDHHGLTDAAGQKIPRSTCAMRQVFDYLVDGEAEGGFGLDLHHLRPIVDLVYAGDTGQLAAHGYGLSPTLGLHSILNGMRSLSERKVLDELAWREEAGSTVDEHELLQKVDRAAMEHAHHIFDALAVTFVRRSEVKKQLDSWTIYTSADGRVIGLKDNTYGAVAEAMDRGAHLVIASSERRLPHTFQLEVWAKRDTGINVLSLIRSVKCHAATSGNRPDIVEELDRMYLEPLFGVRGSPKAPDPHPITIDVRELCALLDARLPRGHDAA